MGKILYCKWGIRQRYDWNYYSEQVTVWLLIHSRGGNQPREVAACLRAAIFLFDNFNYKSIRLLILFLYLMIVVWEIRY